MAGDRKAGRDARQLGARRHVVDHLRAAEPLDELGGVDGQRRHRTGGDACRRLADETAELALETAHTGLTRVPLDHRTDHVVGHDQLVVAQAGTAALTGQQVALGDVDLLVLDVAVEADDVHPVEQRSGDAVGHVGGGEEHDLRQVEVDLEVVVAERVVLRRVEHLQQGRRRIARPPAGGELVDLVEQHDRVHRARLDEGADDPARLRPDVGAAVTTDLGLVADAAERDAHELASHRPGDRLAETRLADPWRADEGDDRAVAAPAVALALVETALVPELAGGEELDDAVLDVVEAVVVVVEHALGVLEIDGVVAAVVPRQLEDAVEPGADP